MTTLDTKNLGTIDGFDIVARLVPDEDATPYDADCYSAEDISAWKSDEWSYVGTIITASKAGIELGSASLWGSEYGLLPEVDRWVSPLDGEGESFVNGYGPGLIDDAITEAKAKIAELRSES